MQAGRLRKSAEFFDQTTVENPLGAIETTPVSLGTFHGEVKAFTATEATKGGVTVTKVKYRLSFRYNATLAGLKPDGTVVVDGKSLSITGSFDPTGRHREIVVIAEDHQ